jgi:flagellar hook-associated protein 3 FlgL
MTINPATAGSGWFLNGISNLQQQLTQTERQLSSGFQVADAADSPGQTGQLVSLESSLAAVKGYQANLVRVQAESTGADQALGSAISLIDNAKTLAVQAGSGTLSPAALQSIATGIQGIQQQIAGIANTTVEGRYIFGGSQDQSSPYQFNATTGAITALTASTATRVIADTQGQPVFQSLTARQIFDPRDAAGVSTDNSTLAALASLSAAVASGIAGNNAQPALEAALASLENVSTYLNQQQSYYGAAEQRLTSEQNSTANQITGLQVGIAGIRDTNIAQAATDLATETTDQSAAYGAQAAISKKSLFDYLG